MVGRVYKYEGFNHEIPKFMDKKTLNTDRTNVTRRYVGNMRWGDTAAGETLDMTAAR